MWGSGDVLCSQKFPSIDLRNTSLSLSICLATKRPEVQRNYFFVLIKVQLILFSQHIDESRRKHTDALWFHQQEEYWNPLLPLWVELLKLQRLTVTHCVPDSILLFVESRLPPYPGENIPSWRQTIATFSLCLEIITPFYGVDNQRL